MRVHTGERPYKVPSPFFIALRSHEFTFVSPLGPAQAQVQAHHDLTCCLLASLKSMVGLPNQVTVMNDTLCKGKRAWGKGCTDI